MNFAKKFLRRKIVSIAHIVSEEILKTTEDPLSFELNKRAIKSSVDYVSQHLQNIVVFPNKKDLYTFAFTAAHIEGSYIELGVYSGESINYISKLALTRSEDRELIVHGFDSFQGLAEDWKGSIGFTKGHFSLSGQLPFVHNNVELHAGLFSDTLPIFIREHPEPIAFLHVDCDNFESTAQALEVLGAQIKSGTIVLFDEYVGFPGWQFGEFLAWQEYVRDNDISYEYLGFSNQTALIRIL